jgi:hypothetical protein
VFINHTHNALWRYTTLNTRNACYGVFDIVKITQDLTNSFFITKKKLQSKLTVWYVSKQYLFIIISKNQFSLILPHQFQIFDHEHPKSVLFPNLRSRACEVVLVRSCSEMDSGQRVCPHIPYIFRSPNVKDQNVFSKCVLGETNSKCVQAVCIWPKRKVNINIFNSGSKI